MTVLSTRFQDRPIRTREVITRSDIDSIVLKKQQIVVIGAHCTITDEAREHAQQCGIQVVSGAPKPKVTAPIVQPATSLPNTKASTIGDQYDLPTPALVNAIVAVLHDMKLQPSEGLVRLVAARIIKATLTNPA